MDDFAQIALPSLFQANNVPWLLRNDYVVHFDVYTLDSDAARVSALLNGLADSLGSAKSALIIKIAAWQTTDGRPTNEQLKSTFFDMGMRMGIETRMKVMIAGADLFYGDGSIRNAATYAQNPGAVVCGMYLRVDHNEASRRLAKLRERTGSAVVTNAQLVDIGLRTLIPALRASLVDLPDNASMTTGSSLRRITDELYTFVQQLPAAFVYSFDKSDRDYFFNYGGGRLSSIDHVWPAKLIAEHRWRVLGSSDLFFCLELTPSEVAATGHTYPIEANRQYNEAYVPTTLHSNVNQCFVTTLRAEPTFTD